MAYIGKFRDGWRAQIQKDGVRVSKTFDLKKDAQKWATEQESKKSLAKSKTLREACDHYVKTVSVSKVKAEKKEKLRLDALCAHFGDDMPLADITSEAMGAWRDTRLQTVTASTVLREVNLYRNMFKIAVKEWKWITESPFEGVRLPKEGPPRNTVWTWKLIKRILRAPRTGKTAEMQYAFLVALHTGLRLEEVLTCSYDVARNILTLPRTKTEQRVITVPTVPRARKVLRSLPKFTVGPNEGSTLFSALRTELLIEGLTYHDSRATALTMLARRMDVLTLARISRHKNINILMNTYYRETSEQISARL